MKRQMEIAQYALITILLATGFGFCGSCCHSEKVKEENENKQRALGWRVVTLADAVGDTVYRVDDFRDNYAWMASTAFKSKYSADSCCQSQIRILKAKNAHELKVVQ